MKKRLEGGVLDHGADSGNRTRTPSLEGWCSAIKLHPHSFPRDMILSTRPIPESNQDRQGIEPMPHISDKPAYHGRGGKGENPKHGTHR